MKSLFAAFCCLLSAVLSFNAHAAVPAASYLTLGPGLSAVQKVTNDDGDRYRVEVTLTNTTSAAVNWTATLDAGVKLTNLWGATHQLVDGRERIKGLSTIVAGASYGWGYEGDRLVTAAPTASSYLTLSSGLTAVQKVTHDDGDRYRVEVTLTNTTSTGRGWTATLDAGVKLTNLWGATHQLVDGRERIKGPSKIAAGASYGWGYEGDRVQAGTAPVPAPAPAPAPAPEPAPVPAPATSTPPPSFITNVTAINFPDTQVGQSVKLPFVIRNSGKVNLNLTGIVASGPNATEFTMNACPATLLPGARCNVYVTAKPLAAGVRSATVTVTARNVAARTVALRVNALGLVTAPTPAPVPPAAGGYRVAGGQIYDAAGRVVQVRGINMYGFNADILIPQYLWQVSWKSQLQQVKDLGFNAIRVPFAPDTLYYPTPGYFDAGKNPEFVGKTPLQILDIWLAEADRLGLHFVLDFHSVSRFGQNNTWHTTNGKITWNGQPYTEDHWVRDLVLVANRYEHLSHFMGIDLYNEPTGEVRWGNGDTVAYKPENDWKRAAERAGSAILAANPNILAFVEGISANYDGIEDNTTPINFAENLRPQAYLPINLPANRLVFAPHSYGPDVYEKSTFNHPSFPANLAADWEKLFGRFYPQHPIVMGEFGGRYGDGLGGARDITWQNAFVDYLISKNIRGGFYWCYTPNSWDTGGILDDNLVVREDKMALLRRLWGT